MPTRIDDCLRQVEEDGFTALPQVFGPDQVDAILQGVARSLGTPHGQASAIRGQEGAVYAARNILAVWPEAAEAWRVPRLPGVLEALLGPRYGLVRALFFDKPPGLTWSLPWHKDLTVAVRDNRLPSARFGKPTRKAGVPHVEAPREVLEMMLTARIHLDDVTEENGPLKVIPGSHREGKATADGTALPRTVLARRGDVLLIRPLVEHCSGRSHPETARHRRILHLEFAGSPDLPDGYAWHQFHPGRR
jgi:hypothetical protein